MNYAESLRQSLTPLPAAFQEAGLKLLAADSKSQDADFYDMVFRNDSSGISLKISISLKQGSISAFVTGPGLSFDLKEYLGHKGRKSEFVANYFLKEPKVYVENLSHLIKTEWREILKGSHKVDIPRDWMGYK
jgi:hypothetical protein